MAFSYDKQSLILLRAMFYKAKEKSDPIMTDYLIYNAHCLDPENGRIFHAALTIKNGLIDTILETPFPDLSEYKAFTAIDAHNQYLSPGFIDISVGLAALSANKFSSLSQAALKGGITSVILEPNMNPAIDTPAICTHILNTANQDSDIHIHTMASLTKNHAQTEMSPHGLLKKSGAIALSHTDQAIDNNLLLLRSLIYASSHDMLVSLYPENTNLANSGIAHEGFVSTLYGLEAHPIEAETLGLERDLILAAKANAKLHIQQISTQKSLDIIKRYKDAQHNISVSCSMQHVSFNEHDVIPYRSFLKMRPPLRTEQDRRLIAQAVCSGDIDILTSAHRPCLEDVKRLPYGEAEYGCASIENMLGVILNLYHSQSEHNLAEIIRCVTINPANRFNLPAGTLKEGTPADLVIFDADQGYQVTRENMKSMATNTPYDRQMMQGVVTCAFINGKYIKDI